MGKSFNSWEDAMKYAAENFKNPYFICSCALEQATICFVDEFVSPMQLDDSIEHVFFEAQNNFGTDWKTVLLGIIICCGKNKKPVSVHTKMSHELYDTIPTQIFREISDAFKNELFIYMVNHLGE